MGIPSGQELTNTLLKLDPTCRIVVTDLGPWYADGSKTYTAFDIRGGFSKEWTQSCSAASRTSRSLPNAPGLRSRQVLSPSSPQFAHRANELFASHVRTFTDSLRRLAPNSLFQAFDDGPKRHEMKWETCVKRDLDRFVRIKKRRARLEDQVQRLPWVMNHDLDYETTGDNMHQPRVITCAEEADTGIIAALRARALVHPPSESILYTADYDGLLRAGPELAGFLIRPVNHKGSAPSYHIYDLTKVATALNIFANPLTRCRLFSALKNDYGPGLLRAKLAYLLNSTKSRWFFETVDDEHLVDAFKLAVANRETHVPGGDERLFVASLERVIHETKEVFIMDHHSEEREYDSKLFRRADATIEAQRRYDPGFISLPQTTANGNLLLRDPISKATHPSPPRTDPAAELFILPSTLVHPGPAPDLPSPKTESSQRDIQLKESRCPAQGTSARKIAQVGDTPFPSEWEQQIVDAPEPPRELDPAIFAERERKGQETIRRLEEERESRPLPIGLLRQRLKETEPERLSRLAQEANDVAAWTEEEEARARELREDVLDEDVVDPEVQEEAPPAIQRSPSTNAPAATNLPILKPHHRYTSQTHSVSLDKSFRPVHPLSFLTPTSRPTEDLQSLDPPLTNYVLPATRSNFLQHAQPAVRSLFVLDHLAQAYATPVINAFLAWYLPLVHQHLPSRWVELSTEEGFERLLRGIVWLLREDHQTKWVRDAEQRRLANEVRKARVASQSRMTTRNSTQLMDTGRDVEFARPMWNLLEGLGCVHGQLEDLGYFELVALATAAERLSTSPTGWCTPRFDILALTTASALVVQGFPPLPAVNDSTSFWRSSFQTRITSIFNTVKEDGIKAIEAWAGDSIKGIEKVIADDLTLSAAEQTEEVSTLHLALPNLRTLLRGGLLSTTLPPINGPRDNVDRDLWSIIAISDRGADGIGCKIDKIIHDKNPLASESVTLRLKQRVRGQAQLLFNTVFDHVRSAIPLAKWICGGEDVLKGQTLRSFWKDGRGLSPFMLSPLLDAAKRQVGKSEGFATDFTPKMTKFDQARCSTVIAGGVARAQVLTTWINTHIAPTFRPLSFSPAPSPTQSNPFPLTGAQTIDQTFALATLDCFEHALGGDSFSTLIQHQSPIQLATGWCNTLQAEIGALEAYLEVHFTSLGSIDGKGLHFLDVLFNLDHLLYTSSSSATYSTVPTFPFYLDTTTIKLSTIDASRPFVRHGEPERLNMSPRDLLCQVLEEKSEGNTFFDGRLTEDDFGPPIEYAPMDNATWRQWSTHPDRAVTFTPFEPFRFGHTSFHVRDFLRTIAPLPSLENPEPTFQAALELEQATRVMGDRSRRLRALRKVSRTDISPQTRKGMPVEWPRMEKAIPNLRALMQSQLTGKVRWDKQEEQQPMDVDDQPEDPPPDRRPRLFQGPPAPALNHSQRTHLARIVMEDCIVVGMDFGERNAVAVASRSFNHQGEPVLRTTRIRSKSHQESIRQDALDQATTRHNFSLALHEALKQDDLLFPSLVSASIRSSPATRRRAFSRQQEYASLARRFFDNLASRIGITAMRNSTRPSSDPEMKNGMADLPNPRPLGFATFEQLSSTRARRIVIAVGRDNGRAGKKKGAHNVHIGVRLTRDFVKYLKSLDYDVTVVKIDEHLSSQMCPRLGCYEPAGTPEAGKRSRMYCPDKANDVSQTCFRVKVCPCHHEGFDRDYSASVNMIYIFLHQLIWGFHPFTSVRAATA